MKTLILRFMAIASGLCPLALATGQIVDGVLNRFDNPDEVLQWRFDFGSVTHTETFDSALDAQGNPFSGSMRVTLNFDVALGGENKGAYTRDLFPGLDGGLFTAMSMDLRVDAASAVDAFGNNGYFQMVIRNTGNYDYNVQFGDNIRSADGWRHIEVSPLAGAVNEIRGVTFQLYGGPSQNIPGPVTLWMDNIQFTPVPEPSTWALLALGALGSVGLLRLRRAAG